MAHDKTFCMDIVIEKSYIPNVSTDVSISDVEEFKFELRKVFQKLKVLFPFIEKRVLTSEQLLRFFQLSKKFQ